MKKIYNIRTRQHGPSWARFWVATVLNTEWAEMENRQIRRLSNTQRGALVKAELKLIKMHRKEAAHKQLTYTFEVD